MGDDIDDVFAVGLALSSPELHILGLTSSWGDTELKARLLDRLLCETGRTDIPVAVGIQGQGTFTQRRWAERQPEKPRLDAVPFLLDQIKQHPGEISLIALGPLTNVSAAIKKDPETFHKLKRIVIMGGSIRKGYNDLGFNPTHGPDAEYNIANGHTRRATGLYCRCAALRPAARLHSIEARRFEASDALRPKHQLTDAMALLYEQWSLEHHLVEPTL